MNQTEENQRKALLRRQAGTILRGEVARHDRAAGMIDGGMSEAEKREIRVMIEIMKLRIEKATLEYRLSLLS